MRASFVDTFYLIALLSPSEDHHEHADRLVDELEADLVTTAWIVTEASSSMSRPPFRQKWINFYNEILKNKRFEVVPPSADLYTKGMTLYQNYKDKYWSLTDCISFVVMRERGITHALTADRHFEQAGFTIEFK